MEIHHRTEWTLVHLLIPVPASGVDPGIYPIVELTNNHIVNEKFKTDVTKVCLCLGPFLKGKTRSEQIEKYTLV